MIINQNFHRRMEDNAVGGDRCGEHGHGVQKVCQGQKKIKNNNNNFLFFYSYRCGKHGHGVCQGRRRKCYECLNVSLF